MMMDELEMLADYVKSKADSLIVGDDDDSTLRRNLRLLEEGSKKLDIKSLKEDELMQTLWLHLVKISVKSKNTKLCLLLVAKLKLVQLALVMRANLQENSQNRSRGQSITLAHAANYFHLNEEEEEEFKKIYALGDRRKSLTLFEHEQLVDLHIDRDRWQVALNLIDDHYEDSSVQNKLNKSMIRYKFAQNLEMDENFEEALKNFNQSGTERWNAPRVILKQFMNLAYRELRNYCQASANSSLQNLWSEYSLMMVNQSNSNQLSESITNLEEQPSAVIRTTLIRGGLDKLESRILEFLPQVACDFIYDTKSTTDKWANKRKLDSLKMVGGSLTSNQRRILAEVAIIYQQMEFQAKACDLYLFLNQTEIIVGLAHRFLPPISSVRVAHHLNTTTTSGLAYNLIHYINCLCLSSSKRIEQEHSHHREREDENSTRFLAYLKLGLLDEALQVLAIDSACKQDEQIIRQAVEQLQNITKTNINSTRHLDQIDPEIRGATLVNLQKSLLNEQTLVTQVMTVIIMALNIFLLKLDPQAISHDNEEGFVGNVAQLISKLEIMFKVLVESYLEVLNYDATDTLVKATNSLVGSVKDKLDVLSDSEIIRQNFRKLVELLASKCMIEGRYKQAAVLYSQIEDNLNAVKSLMRTGDVDIVVNYSLLVRDITVNRLTINYLKHLNVEQEVMEDFIYKSKL